jgi:hypothetical protein
MGDLSLINFSKEYKNLYNNYVYYDKEKIKKIFLIFEGKGGSQIITKEIIPKTTNIQDFLVLNSEMERALKFITTQVKKLSQYHQQTASFLFYFSQYGGSKTQFLNLVEEENQKLPKTIIVFFDDLTQLKPTYIFKQILAQLIHKLGSISDFDDSTNFKRFFGEIYSVIEDINITFRQSNNLRKAEDLIEILDTDNPKRKEALKELNDLLHSTILVDNLEVLQKVSKLMQICSRYNLVFLFLFDEVDLWLDEESTDLRFSSAIMRISKFMKYLLELPDHEIKLFFLFACTDRVNRLFQEQQTEFSIKSPTASRLIRIYQTAEKVSESGTYGDSIDNAFLKLAVLFDISHDEKSKVDESFFNKAIEPLKRKFNDIPRRNCNSIIIRLLNCYNTLYPSVQSGLNNWINYTEKYGNLIQDHLDSILKRLNIKFVRKDILIDPSKSIVQNKIDGYFINYDYKGLEKRIHTEIKVTKKFTDDKVRQVLQWLQLHPEESFILLVFSPTPFEEIEKQINIYAEKLDYDLRILKNLHIIHVDDPYSFCAINGISKVMGDVQSLAKFLDDFSFWFDFFGDFTESYQEIQQKIGFFWHPPKEERKEVIEEEKKEDEEVIKEGIVFTKEQNNCLQLLAHMFRENEFTSSGLKRKSSIQQIVEKKSMGITNLDRLYKTMKEFDIIQKIMDNSIRFSIKERDEILNLSLEDFVEELKRRFASGPKNPFLNY